MAFIRILIISQTRSQVNKLTTQFQKFVDNIRRKFVENSKRWYKILKDDIATKQKLLDSLLQQNNLLPKQQDRLTTELLTPTRKNNCRERNKDVIQTENNIRQEEMPVKPGISKTNKLPLKKKSV